MKCGSMEGCHSTIGTNVRIGAKRNEQFYHCTVVGKRSKDQRCDTTSVLLVDACRGLAEDLANTFDLTSLDGLKN